MTLKTATPSDSVSITESTLETKGNIYNLDQTKLDTQLSLDMLRIDVLSLDI